jgi:hypothetical protein
LHLHLTLAVIFQASVAVMAINPAPETWLAVQRSELMQTVQKRWGLVNVSQLWQPQVFQTPNAQAAWDEKSITTGEAPLAEPQQAIVPKLSLPFGFTPQWHAKQFDGGRFKLNVLRQGFGLSQTTGGLGGEYLSYWAQALGELTPQAHSDQLRHDLSQLSVLAQELSGRLIQLGQSRYEGVPDQRMRHLAIRQQLNDQLSAFGTTTWTQAHLNQHGALIRQSQAALGQTAAHTTLVQDLSRRSESLLQHPEVKASPQLSAWIRQTTGRVEGLVSHLGVRWESTHVCRAGTCSASTIFMTLAPVQMAANQPLVF